MKPPVPADEARRLTLLAETGIVGSEPEEGFDDLARVAATLCAAPTAFVSFVESDVQWFKARVGFDAATTSRDDSFCGHALTEPEVLVVRDALADPRFADNRFVLGPPHYRFYAGVPLRVADGSAIGTLCVLDYEPRDLTEAQLDALRAIARQIERELRLRRRARIGAATVAAKADAAKATADDEDRAVAVGDMIPGGWRLEREIGRGAVGVVYEARRGDERAAVKVLLRQWSAVTSIVERFAREARVMSRMTSPHAVRLLDVGNLDAAHRSVPYLVLEYLEGEDLLRVMDRRGRVTWQEAVGWIADACLSLAEAHGLGFVHRDLKPSNVFLARVDGAAEPVVKVLDFGIAKLTLLPVPASTKLTSQDAVLGTPHYMAPEQLKSAKGVDARADVWSLGVMLYELVTGRLPFEGKGMLDVLASVILRPHVEISGDVPARVRAVIDRCLQKERDARYADVVALRADLLAARA